MCVDMGGGFTLSGKGGSQGVHEEGVHRGFTKRGVHVNPVNPLATGLCAIMSSKGRPIRNNFVTKIIIGQTIFRR